MRVKIGSFEVSLGERKKPRRVELGATGTLFFAGQLVEEEYNPDLQGEKAFKVYDRMRRSDGQVAAALLACELPLHAARWDIESASDTRDDQKIAQFVRENIFEQMTITWDDFLAHVLMMLPFGFSIFEKVWELDGGKYRWRKLAPRLQRTLHKWDVDNEGGLRGIVQYVHKDLRFEQVDIPVEKLLVFTNHREGSNFEGISILRAAYKHWYYKDQLYRIDGISAERHGVGMAVFSLPHGATTEGGDSDYARVDKIGRALHTHERSYIALPSDYGFELKGISGQLHDIIKSVDHHDMQIARSILAQFINLGGKEVGSYALSQDQSGFFLMALRAVGRNVCDTINRHAIRQLVDYNWQVKRYPKLVVSGLEQRELGSYCKAISDVVNAGLVLPDRDIEAELRQVLHLPASKKTAARKPQEPPGEGAEPPDPTGGGAQKPPEEESARAYRLAEFELPRYPRGPEIYVAFAELNDKLDTAEEAFVGKAKQIQDRQISRIIDAVARYVEKGEIDKVTTVDVPLRNEMAEAIGGVLLDLYDYGRAEVKKEIAKQRGGVRATDLLSGMGDEAVHDFIRARGKATAGVLAAKLRAAMTWSALHQAKAGVVDKAALRQSLTALSDKELVATAKFSVSESVNLGRQQEALAEADEIDRVIYSAILDRNTCGPCAALDGREFAFPSAEWDKVTPPYEECEGGDRCRCVGVYVYKSERRGLPITPPKPTAPPEPAPPKPFDPLAPSKPRMIKHGKVSSEVIDNVDETMRKTPLRSMEGIRTVHLYEEAGPTGKFDSGTFKTGGDYSHSLKSVRIFNSGRYAKHQADLDLMLGHEAGHAGWREVDPVLKSAFTKATDLEKPFTDYARKWYEAHYPTGYSENFAELHGLFTAREPFEMNILINKCPKTFKAFTDCWVSLGGMPW